MTAPEFSRTVRVDILSEAPRQLRIEAAEGERIALARRFGLLAIDRLAADLALTRAGTEVAMRGALFAGVVQACVATGEPVRANVETPFDIRFRPHPDPGGPDAEIELGDGEMDVVFYDLAAIDVGEAVAETLLLSLDPYPRAPGAEAALRAAGVKGEEEAGAFGALAGLRDKLKKDGA
jgi:uncharacterized metal-binding protein YceD (DUF177 family)